MIPDITNIPILIVEDDPASMLLFKEILEPTGAKLYFASNEVELYKALTHSEIRMVLLDIKFGDTTGFELLPIIKKSLPQAKVIAQTAFIFNFDKQSFLSKGFDAFIQKPIQMKELLALVTSLID